MNDNAISISGTKIVEERVDVLISPTELHEALSEFLRSSNQIPPDGWMKGGQIVVEDFPSHGSGLTKVAVAKPTSRQLEVMEVLHRLRTLFKEID